MEVLATPKYKMAGEIFLIVIIVLAIVAYLIYYFDKKKLNKLNETYNPDEDKSRQGEDRRSTRGRESVTTLLSEPKRQSVSERTDIGEDGENSSSVREVSRAPHPFRRLQKQ